MSEYHNFLLKKNRDQYSPESLCKQLLHFYYLKRGSIWTYARAGRQDTMAAKQQPFAQREVVLSKVCKSKKGFTHFWEYYLIHQQYAWDSYFLLPAKKKEIPENVWLSEVYLIFCFQWSAWNSPKRVTMLIFKTLCY